MRLTPCFTKRMFKNHLDFPVRLTVIEANTSNNGLRIRLWETARSEQPNQNAFSRCSDAEVRRLENALGEVDTDRLRFVQHPQHGRVATVDD